MAKKSLKTLAALAIAFTMTARATVPDRMDSVSVTTATLKALPRCLKYRVVGVCFWLTCDWLGCSIGTTARVDHYLPDLVDTVYSRYGRDPWTEINDTMDRVAHAGGNALFEAVTGHRMRGGGINTAGSHDGNVTLREVNVIGNPALAALHWSWLLRGQATPFMPYYQSQLDAVSWRSGLLEQLYPRSWTSNGRIGRIGEDWGSVYPRGGFLMQANPGRAAAVFAARGGSIATTRSFGHLHRDLNAEVCRDHACSTAGAISGHAPGVLWQMILPVGETACGDRIDSGERPAWTRNQPSGRSYAWIVWREYRGCVRGRGIYLGSV